VLAEHYAGRARHRENLFSAIDGRNLLRYAPAAGSRLVQFDPALSTASPNTLRFSRRGKQMGWSRRRFIPHGGTSRAQYPAGLQASWVAESYPGVFQPYGGFADSIRSSTVTCGPTTRPGSAWSSKSRCSPRCAPPWSGVNSP